MYRALSVLVALCVGAASVCVPTFTAPDRVLDCTVALSTSVVLLVEASPDSACGSENHTLHWSCSHAGGRVYGFPAQIPFMTSRYVFSYVLPATLPADVRVISCEFTYDDDKKQVLGADPKFVLHLTECACRAAPPQLAILHGPGRGSVVVRNTALPTCGLHTLIVAANDSRAVFSSAGRGGTAIVSIGSGYVARFPFTCSQPLRLRLIAAHSTGAFAFADANVCM